MEEKGEKENDEEKKMRVNKEEAASMFLMFTPRGADLFQITTRSSSS